MDDDTSPTVPIGGPHGPNRTTRLARPAGGPGQSGPPELPDGRYRLGTVLGQGGMGVVYEAYDPALDRSVAVKILRPDLADDEEMRTRFVYEARILGKLEHPGVLPVFSAGDLPQSGSYYAMKRVQGRTLREIIKEAGGADRMDSRGQARLLDIYSKLCQTVAYAHSQGIVHRDLKPENVMVDEFGVVLVMDWGLSKKVDQSAEDQGILATQPGIVKGTPAYMSPEQASGSTTEVDFRSDVFALGIILYEVLTGRMPFSGKTHSQVLTEIIHNDPPPPRQHNRRVNRVLSAICLKALSKDPAERYPSAEELAEDIRLHRAYQTTSAYQPGVLEQVGAWVARHTALTAALGTAAALVVLFAGLLLHWRDADRIRSEEIQERERLLAQLGEQRQKERLHETMLRVREYADRAGRYDERVIELQKTRNAMDPQDTREVARIDKQIAELRTARHMTMNAIRYIVAKMVAEQSDGEEEGTAEIVPELMPLIRELVLSEIRAQIKYEGYYRAHHMLWSFLRSPERLGWSDQDVAMLKRLRDDVEAEIRKIQGPDLPMPDWAEYRGHVATETPK